jgi:hypothetical protein
MKKFIPLVAFLTSFLFPIVSRAQETPNFDGPQNIFHDDLLDHMVGDWHLSGSVMGETADHHVHVEWVLNHQFLRIHEKAAVPSKAGLVYEAMVMVGYDNASERYVAHWIDIFGGRFSETLGYGHRDASKIEFLFEYPDGPFRTTFRWDAETKAWHWQMRQKDKSGAWTDFSNFILTVERKQ